MLIAVKQDLPITINTSDDCTLSWDFKNFIEQKKSYYKSCIKKTRAI